jgi:two-component system, chemotaxis family, response regulator Rcp1
MDPKERRDQTRRRLDILLVENDAGMAELTNIAFKEAGLLEGVTSVSDGEEALAFLRRKEGYQMHSHPDMIFLDLHLPKLTGMEVLEEIKTNPNWSATPVIVVSGYSDLREIRRAYELHASCYIRKPDDLDEFLQFAKVCYDFWGSVVTLPQIENQQGRDPAA